MKRALLIFLSLVYSCSTTSHLKVGCYEANNDNLVVYYHLQLKPDYSYYFNSKGDMYSATQEGRWSIKGNKLILNSFIQPESTGYFKELQDTIKEPMRFVLFDINGKPIVDNDHVYIKQKSNYIVLKHQISNVYSLNYKIKGDYVIGVGVSFKEVKVNVQNTNSNKILVYLIPDAKGFFQTNQRFLIKDSTTFISKTFVFSKKDCNK